MTPEPLSDQLTRAAEIRRVLAFLESRGVALQRGYDGEPLYHGGHSQAALVNAYAASDERQASSDA